MNGNWSQLDMTQLGASVTHASLALGAFWGMVTVGRIGFAAIERRFPTWRTYHLLPFVLAIALVAVWQLPHAAGVLGVLAFALAGLGCSALLPLTISFGQEQLAGIATAVAGGVIASYQLGYGIAAIGGGKLQDAGVVAADAVRVDGRRRARDGRALVRPGAPAGARWGALGRIARDVVVFDRRGPEEGP